MYLALEVFKVKFEISVSKGSTVVNGDGRMVYLYPKGNENT